MKKGTVAFVGNFNIVQLNAAGKRVEGLAAAIIDEYNIAFIGFSNTNRFIEIAETESGVSVAFFPNPTSNLMRLSVKKYFLFTLKALSTISDLKCIISYGSPVLSPFVSSLQRWSKKKKIIFISDVVDMIFYNGQGGLSDKVKYYDTKNLKKGIIPRSDGIIAISSTIQKYYQNMGCKNVVVIPPITNRKETPQGTQSGGDKVNIVYAGVPFNRISNIPKYMMKDRLDWSIDIVRGVIQKGVNVQFDIIGLTKEEFLYSLPEYTEALEGLNGIRFHGKASQGDVEKAIQASDFTILSREKTEVTESGFPTKFSESLCVGTPVIATNTSDIKKYLIEYKNGVFLDFGVTSENIGKLVDVLSDKELIGNMKKYCKDNYPFLPRKFKSRMQNLLQNC